MVYTILLSALIFLIAVVACIAAYNCGYSGGHRRGLSDGMSLFNHIIQSCGGDEE